MEVPEDLQQITFKLLAKDPAQRYAKPALLIEALKKFVGTDPEAPKLKPSSPQMETYLEELSREEPMPAAAGRWMRRRPWSWPVSSRSPRLPASGWRSRLPRPKCWPPSVAGVRSSDPPPVVPQAAGPAKLIPIAKPPVPDVNVEPVNLDELFPAPWRLPISRDLFMILTGR